MPKVLSYTPPWLSRPSPGFELFSTTPKPTRSPGGTVKYVNDYDGGSPRYTGAKRTIARRGTEVFVAIGNQIRWSDLCLLKDNWEEEEHGRRESKGGNKGKGNSSNGTRKNRIEEQVDDRHGESYRILKVPVTEQIRQLIPSPKGEYLAILTAHTVHIAVLPDSSHLGQPDTGPIRLKTHTLGPTTHVTSQSPVVSALWHPLGVSGNCLVTITAEAVVRMWELNRENRWSFDSPTLAIDLKKLVDGTSCEEDFGASSMGRNKGFSADSFEMEVASACFGGVGLDEENGWASMTLWIAMREGGIYALCPLLPAKWQPSATLVPSLSTSVVAKVVSQEHDSTVPTSEKTDCAQQYKWLTEIDQQDPSLATGESECAPQIEVYNRPEAPGPIPRLQGPFELEPDVEDSYDDFENLITDIYVMGAKIDEEALMLGEDTGSELDELARDSLSIAVICILTSSGRLHVCLDLDGVEGKWLPNKRNKSGPLKSPYTPQSLTVLESIETMRLKDVQNTTWPAFTVDPLSKYSFFITHGNGVTYLSLSPWIVRLESELQNAGDAGASFRMEVFMEGSKTLRESILYIPKDEDRKEPIEADQSSDLSGCLVFQDSDLGYFLLTVASTQPYTVTLDQPNQNSLHETNGVSTERYESEMKALVLSQPRSVYSAPASLWSHSALPTFLDTHVPTRHKRTMKEEIRLSTATLDLMTEAHRVLSQETHQLGIAAADLFRRCERLQDEFRDQIRRANDVAYTVDQITGDDADDLGENDRPRGNAGLEQRVENVMSRQTDLNARADMLRRKLARSGGKDLSEKEQAWASEVDRMELSILDEGHDDKTEHQLSNSLRQRYEGVTQLKEDLLSQVNNATKEAHPDGVENVKLPSELRKAKVAQVMGLLHRESALVDAAQNRLEKLSLSSI
ncbi:MAG: hypothetical protein M1827_007223 [Pycnora praestabilis]|nr:MAG: hypothetical protein M1827_007223 [Pycnora praestabilis]